LPIYARDEFYLEVPIQLVDPVPFQLVDRVPTNHGFSTKRYCSSLAGSWEHEPVSSVKIILCNGSWGHVPVSNKKCENYSSPLVRGTRTSKLGKQL